MSIFLGLVFLSNLINAQALYENHGLYSASEVAGMKNGDLLYAIRLNKRQYDIKKIPVEVDEVNSSDADSSHSIKAHSSAIILLKRIELKEGKIIAEDLSSFRLPEVGKEKALVKGLGTVRAGGKVLPKEEGSKISEVEDYSLTFTKNGMSATISDAGTGRPGFKIMFLGDFNRDGYPDIYLNTDRMEKEGDSILYVSEIKDGKFQFDQIRE